LLNKLYSHYNEKYLRECLATEMLQINRVKDDEWVNSRFNLYTSKYLEHPMRLHNYEGGAPTQWQI